MIIPDINLLIYAYTTKAPQHVAAQAWWEKVMQSRQPIGLPWAVSLGFLRLMTHPAVLTAPLSHQEALTIIASWFDRDHVQILDPGPQHLQLLGDLLDSAGIAANLTTDAHLAALAIEHNCELHSNDADFGRFSGLRWINPLI